MPKEIAGKVKEWKRPDKIFGIDELVVQPTDDKNDILNVLAVNEPLMNVKVIKKGIFNVVFYKIVIKLVQNIQWSRILISRSCQQK